MHTLLLSCFKSVSDTNIQAVSVTFFFLKYGFRKIMDFIKIKKQNTTFFFGEISIESMGFNYTGDDSGHPTPRDWYLPRYQAQMGHSKEW